MVLNWNGWQDTIACVESLLSQDYPALSILVVDNQSTNDSVARIEAALPSVDLIIADSNRGFSAGCNIGIVEALKRDTDFVWLLNNDTIAPPDTLSKLVAASATSKAGIVGSVLRYMHNPAEVQAWGGGSVIRTVGVTKHFIAPTALDQDSFLTFASVLISSALIAEIGLLDEDFFMYFEDTDYCLRAKDAGWELAVAADTAILHKEGGTASTHRSRTMERIFTASGMRFLRRHGCPKLLSPFLFLLLRVGKRTLRLDLQGAMAVVKGARDWWHGDPMAFRSEAKS